MNAIPTGGLTSPSLSSAGGGGGAASQQQQNQFQQQQEANNNNSQLRSESRNLQKGNLILKLYKSFLWIY